MASTTINNNQRSFTASGTVGQYLAVALQTDGKVAVATSETGANQKVIGFSTVAASDGEAVRVSLSLGGGTVFAKAKSTITNAGTFVYPADSGLIGVTATTNRKVIGITLQSAAADDVIEILPLSVNATV